MAEFRHPHLDPAPSDIPPALRRWLSARLKGPPRGQRTRSRQVCGIALGRIGDFVMLVSSFRLLVREFGPDQCALVVPASVVPLARAELPGVQLFTLPPEAAGLFRDILPVWRRQRAQFAPEHFARRVVYMHARPLYHDLASTWVDADADFRLELANYPTGPAGELQAHRAVTAAALGREVPFADALPRFAHFRATDEGRLFVYPLSHDGSKNLPLARTAKILHFWRARSRAPIVLGGSPRDATLLEAFAVAARGAGVDNVTVETPAGVNPFVVHLATAGAVLSAESAAAHVAGAFDKPTVTLMGPRWYGASQPWQRSERQKVFLFDEADDATVAAALPVI